MRQVYLARHARRPRHARSGPRAGRRAARERAGSAARRDRVPGGRPLPVAERAPERRVRSRAPGRAGGAPAPDGQRAVGPAWALRIRREIPARAVGRDEAARGDRARARARREDPPDGRAVRRTGRADACPHGRVAARHLAAHAQDRDLRHAQPARGAVPLDPGGRHDGAPRPDQGRARPHDGVPALDGVVRDGGAPRQALERDSRGVPASDAMTLPVVGLRLALLALCLALWEVAGRTMNPLLGVPPSAVVPALRDLLLLRSYPDLLSSLALTVREIATA